MPGNQEIHKCRNMEWSTETFCEPVNIKSRRNIIMQDETMPAGGHSAAGRAFYDMLYTGQCR